MRNLKRIGFIGQGKLARGLSALFHESYPNAEIQVWSRSDINKPLKYWSTNTPMRDMDVDLLILAVNDSEIASVARQLAEHTLNAKLVIHCSGNLGVDALSPLASQDCALAAVHPAFSFTGAPVKRTDFAGATVCVESLRGHQPFLEALFSPFAAKLIFSEHISRAQYHAASVMASNLLVGLSHAAQGLAMESGMTAEHAAGLVNSLMLNTLQNIQSSSAKEALTGPIKRGDIATIEKHLAALEAKPEVRNVYTSLSTLISELAHDNNATAQQLRELLAK